MHLLAAITSHGFGHAAQVAPVINALSKRDSNLRVTLFTSLPEQFLRERIHVPFERINKAPDFGLVMHSAFKINLEASAARYADLHGNWEAQIQDQVALLERYAPDVLLADIPYLTLAAAKLAGIPAVALCSLNWADIYRYYFSEQSDADRILSQMEDAYCSAKVFLQPEPSMPMNFLNNSRPIAPIASHAKNKREELVELLGLREEQKIVLVAPGGIDSRFPIEDWPTNQGMHWLVSKSWKVQHQNSSCIEDSQLSMPDIIASCDAVLGKCGYGTVAECVIHGTPLLYIPRPDWPEEKTLLSWLNAHNAAVEVPETLTLTGEFGAILEQASSLQISVCENKGAEQAADCLLAYG